MKTISLVAIVGLALGMLACGRGSAPDARRPADGARKNADAARPNLSEATDPGTPTGAASLRLSSVTLIPSIPTAATDLKAVAVVADPVPDETVIRYRWFVNDKPVTDAETADLPRPYFRKKQWVYCEAMAIAGIEKSGWLSSKRERIANSPPQLGAATVEDIQVPGEFNYQIVATDADADPLTYELVAPLDQGIVLDAKTGSLTWTITSEAVVRLGAALEIQFAVSDDDKGRTQGSLKIELTEKK
jgi:hypothetical protein